MTLVGAEVIGREAELAAVDAFLDAVAAGTAHGPASLVLRGYAGIGKTALWEDAIGRARERGIQVLSTRASQAEGQLSFSGLTDLLDEIDPGAIDDLPDPQRRALQVVLLRAEPDAQPPGDRAIAAGVLRTLRHLATTQRVLVALDDVQWLDAASAEPLAFAARRLRSEPVAFLLTERSGPTSTVRAALPASSQHRLELSGLSFGAARHLLAERTGLSLSRPAMRRIYDVTHGNPLFVLEFGRALSERRMEQPDEDMPLPGDVEDLLGVRIAAMPAAVRTALLAVALSDGLRLSELTTITERGSVDDAVEAGLLVVEGERVRPWHPLLAAVVRRRSRMEERRAVHHQLAAVGADELRGARHLALAAPGPDEALAGTLSAAAQGAAARGARRDAVDLARHALQLTPPGSVRRPERIVALGETLDRSGEFAEMRALLEPEVDRLPSGPLRAHGHLLLLGGSPSIESFSHHLDRAFEHSGDDPGLRARVLAERALDSAVAYLRDLPAAEAWALEAHELSPDALEPMAAVGWTRILRGRSVDDLVERELRAPPGEIYYSARRLQAIRFAFRGELSKARGVFDQLIQLATDRGEEWSYSTIRYQLAELALRGGNLAEARNQIDDVLLAPDNGVGTRPHAPRLEAVRAALSGDPDGTASHVAEARVAVARLGNTAENPNWDFLEVARATGLAALLTGDGRSAAEAFGVVWDHTEREGIDDPGAFPVAPDLVEALVSVGDLGRARAVTARLAGLAHAQAHPWGLASVQRSEALLRLAGEAGDANPAADLAEAAAAYHALGLWFDHARTLLLAGRAHRRARRWNAARSAFEAATAAFDAIAAPGWAELARTELGRISDRGQRPRDALTKSERRVAELAAEGRSNREIAAALFVGEHTVEVHLSRVYAKLGIRSRASLARRLDDEG